MTTHTQAKAGKARRPFILTAMFLIGFLTLTFSGPAFNGADILGLILVTVPVLAIAREVESR